MSSHDPSIVYLSAIANDLNLYFPILLIVIGTIGNLITFLIYTRVEFRRTSIGFYYSCLAVVDTVALYVGSIKYYIKAKYDYNLTTESVFACKFLTSSIYFLAQLSAWITVIASIDRLFSIVRPLHYSLIRRNKLQYVMVGSIFAVLLLLNGPNIMYLNVMESSGLELNSRDRDSEIPRMLSLTNIGNWNRSPRWNLSSSDLEGLSEPNDKTCEIDSTRSVIYNMHVADIIDLFAFAIIPFALMIFSSIVITKRLFEIKSKLKKHNLANKAAATRTNVVAPWSTATDPDNLVSYTNSEIASISAAIRRQSNLPVLAADEQPAEVSNQARKKSIVAKDKKIKVKGNSVNMKKEYQVSLTIIGMNLFFLLLNLPVSLSILVLNVIDAQLLLDGYNKAVGILIFTISNILSYIHFATPFFIHYGLNRNFRSKLKSIFFK